MEKAIIIDTLKKLPKEFDLDDFLEHLLVIEKIGQGLDEAEAGKTLSHDKVKKW